MSKHVIECVTFRLVEGTGSDDFAARAAEFSDWVREQPGFVARSLSCTEDGEWIEHIEWETMQEAKATAAKIGKADEAKPFVSLIDGPSVTLRHAALEVTA